MQQSPVSLRSLPSVSSTFHSTNFRQDKSKNSLNQFIYQVCQGLFNAQMTDLSVPSVISPGKTTKKLIAKEKNVVSVNLEGCKVEKAAILLASNISGSEAKTPAKKILKSIDPKNLKIAIQGFRERKYDKKLSDSINKFIDLLEKVPMEITERLKKTGKPGRLEFMRDRKDLSKLIQTATEILENYGDLEISAIDDRSIPLNLTVTDVIFNYRGESNKEYQWNLLHIFASPTLNFEQIKSVGKFFERHPSQAINALTGSKESAYPPLLGLMSHADSEEELLNHIKYFVESLHANIHRASPRTGETALSLATLHYINEFFEEELDFTKLQPVHRYLIDKGATLLNKHLPKCIARLYYELKKNDASDTLEKFKQCIAYEILTNQDLSPDEVFGTLQALCRFELKSHGSKVPPKFEDLYEFARCALETQDGDRLHRVCARGSWAAVKLIAKYDDKMVNRYDQYGNLPLLLIIENIFLNPQNDGLIKTVSRLTEFRAEEWISCFIESGADVNLHHQKTKHTALSKILEWSTLEKNPIKKALIAGMQQILVRSNATLINDHFPTLIKNIQKDKNLLKEQRDKVIATLKEYVTQEIFEQIKKQDPGVIQKMSNRLQRQEWKDLDIINLSNENGQGLWSSVIANNTDLIEQTRAFVEKCGAKFINQGFLELVKHIDKKNLSQNNKSRGLVADLKPYAIKELFNHVKQSSLDTVEQVLHLLQYDNAFRNLNTIINASDEDGNPLLLTAITLRQENQQAWVEKLIDYGVEVNIPNKKTGQTALSETIKKLALATNNNDRTESGLIRELLIKRKATLLSDKYDNRENLSKLVEHTQKDERLTQNQKNKVITAFQEQMVKEISDKINEISDTGKAYRLFDALDQLRECGELGAETLMMCDQGGKSLLQEMNENVYAQDILQEYFEARGRNLRKSGKSFLSAPFFTKLIQSIDQNSDSAQRDGLIAAFKTQALAAIRECIDAYEKNLSKENKEQESKIGEQLYDQLALIIDCGQLGKNTLALTAESKQTPLEKLKQLIGKKQFNAFEFVQYLVEKKQITDANNPCLKVFKEHIAEELCQDLEHLSRLTRVLTKDPVALALAPKEPHKLNVLCKWNQLGADILITTGQNKQTPLDILVKLNKAHSNFLLGFTQGISAQVEGNSSRPCIELFKKCVVQELSNEIRKLIDQFKVSHSSAVEATRLFTNETYRPFFVKLNELCKYDQLGADILTTGENEETLLKKLEALENIAELNFSFFPTFIKYSAKEDWAKDLNHPCTQLFKASIANNLHDDIGQLDKLDRLYHDTKNMIWPIGNLEAYTEYRHYLLNQHQQLSDKLYSKIDQLIGENGLLGADILTTSDKDGKTQTLLQKLIYSGFKLNDNSFLELIASLKEDQHYSAAQKDDVINRMYEYHRNGVFQQLHDELQQICKDIEEIYCKYSFLAVKTGQTRAALLRGDQFAYEDDEAIVDKKLGKKNNEREDSIEKMVKEVWQFFDRLDSFLKKLNTVSEDSGSKHSQIKPILGETIPERILALQGKKKESHVCNALQYLKRYCNDMRTLQSAISKETREIKEKSNISNISVIEVGAFV